MKQAEAIWNPGPELIDAEGEVRESTADDFERSLAFS